MTLVSELYSSKNESSERNAQSEREKLLDEVNGSEELRRRGAADDPVTQSRAGQEQDRKAIPQDNRTKGSIFSLEGHAVVDVEEKVRPREPNRRQLGGSGGLNEPPTT